MEDIIKKQPKTIEDLKKEIENLQKKLRDRDKFIRIMGHDLRNPISSIYRLIELVFNTQTNYQDEEKKELIQLVLNSSAKVSELVQDIVSWGEVSEEIMKAKPCNTRLLDVVLKNSELYRPIAKQKNINLSLSDLNFDVYVDKNMIDVIFRNLISNAIKFSNPGCDIDISAKENIGFIEVCIKDNGIGMESKNALKIFSENITTHSTGTQGEKGTGLGLGFCKEMVRKNGGQIWYESKIGSGSKFYFTLPQP